MKTIFVRLVVCVLLACAVGSSSPAQSASPDAHISGTLLGISGIGIPEVRVTAQLDGATKTQIWSTLSAADGGYSLGFPAGRYRLLFAAPSFVARTVVLDFSNGQSRNFDLKLDLEPLSSSVVVTAQAEPALLQEATASVTVITRAEIDSRQAVPLTDLLLFTPGVSISRTGAEGGSAALFLNGGNSNYTKVLVDGTPVNNPGSAVDFSNVTLDNIDKVEIVRGAESALYGSDAVAGVIQLFSHRGDTRIPTGSVFSEGGSFSSVRGGADFSGLLGGFDYSGAASYFQTDGQGANNSFRNRTLSGNFGYRFSAENQIRLSLRNNTSDAGIPGQTLLEPATLEEVNDLHNFSANGRWDSASGKHWHQQVSGAESYSRVFSANPVQSFFATDPNADCPQQNPAAIATPDFCSFTFADTSQFNRSSFNAQTSYVLPTFGATAGYQYEIENASISFLGLGHLRRNNQGGFLDFRYRPLTRVSFTLGLRAEANANFGTRVVPRAGASVALRRGSDFWGDTRYHVFYGEGIVEPRFDQTFSSDPCDPGNPTLKPEESKTWNTGIDQKLANDRVKLSADLFSNRFYNIVSFTFCSPGGPCPVTPPPGCPFGFGTFFNTDLARARGANLAIDTHILSWLGVAGSYSYDDSRVLVSPNAFDPSEIPGNRLIRRPPQSGSLTLNAAWRKFNVTLAGYFSGERTDSDFLGLGFTRDPAYARFDVATGYNFVRGFTLYARATNLFDKQYQDALGYPALGRDIRIGMRYHFAGRN